MEWRAVAAQEDGQATSSMIATSSSRRQAPEPRPAEREPDEVVGRRDDAAHRGDSSDPAPRADGRRETS
jgi:hypothetical protein